MNTYKITITKKSGKVILIDLETDIDLRDMLQDDRVWDKSVLIIGNHFIKMDEISDILVEGGQTSG